MPLGLTQMWEGQRPKKKKLMENKAQNGKELHLHGRQTVGGGGRAQLAKGSFFFGFSSFYTG